MSCIPGLLEFNQLVMKEIHIHQPEISMYGAFISQHLAHFNDLYFF